MFRGNWYLCLCLTPWRLDVSIYVLINYYYNGFLLFDPFLSIALKLNFRGIGICKFKEFNAKFIFGKEIEYSGYEQYISSSCYLFKYDQPKLFKPDIYSYDFWYELPEHIPSSLAGKNGKIRYFVEASIKTLYDYEIFTKLPFTIIRFENLSARVDLMEPMMDENIANLCCFSWKTKPLILSASIPYSG